MKDNLTKGLGLFLTSLLLFTACFDTQTSANNEEQEDETEEQQKEQEIFSPDIRIDWSSSSKKVSHDVFNAGYGRVVALSEDTLLLGYHCGPEGNGWDNIAVRRSSDRGATWSEAEIVMPDDNPNYWGFSNPEFLELDNGWVILAYTGRGRPDDNEHDNIQLRISKDRGQTWGDPVIVAYGRSWEPAMTQLPDGEIQLFYSSEARWWNGHGSTNVNQEILLSRSNDNGQSWSDPQQVAYSYDNRDGMPVPLILNEGSGIVFAIESVENSESPWIVWSSMQERWNYATSPSEENGRRWVANKDIWGGGPYLLQLPSGQTLLSVHMAGGRAIGGNWEKNTMAVMIGNSEAKGFTDLTYPWPDQPIDEGTTMNSLFLKDANTVVVIGSYEFPDGHNEVYWKEGEIISK